MNAISPTTPTARASCMLRILAVALPILCFAAGYMDFTYVPSREALAYQRDYPDAIRSGLSPLYLLTKLLFTGGVMAGLVGIVKIAVTKERGLGALSASVPVFVLGAWLQAPPDNYPSLTPLSILLLWYACCATWGAVLALAWGSNMAEPGRSARQLAVLRGLCFLLPLGCALAVWQQWTPVLSKEASDYQRNYAIAMQVKQTYAFYLAPMAMEGGAITGLVGILQFAFAREGGLASFLVGGIVASLGAYLYAPPAAYPDVVPISTILLWCATSAIWGAIAALAYMRHRIACPEATTATGRDSR